MFSECFAKDNKFCDFPFTSLDGELFLEKQVVFFKDSRLHLLYVICLFIYNKYLTKYFVRQYAILS